MAIKGWGTAIFLSEIQAEFGGAAPIYLSEYYRNGGLVPNAEDQIPYAGNTIWMSQFYGAQNITPGVILDRQSNGSGSITIPPNASIEVRVWGAGGGGGDANTPNQRAASGGNSSFAGPGTNLVAYGGQGGTGLIEGGGHPGGVGGSHAGPAGYGGINGGTGNMTGIHSNQCGALGGAGGGSGGYGDGGASGCTRNWDKWHLAGAGGGGGYATYRYYGIREGTSIAWVVGNGGAPKGGGGTGRDGRIWIYVHAN